MVIFELGPEVREGASNQWGGTQQPERTACTKAGACVFEEQSGQGGWNGVGRKEEPDTAGEAGRMGRAYKTLWQFGLSPKNSKKLLGP